MTPAGDLRLQVGGFSRADWDRAVSGLPSAHVLQSWSWGQFKSGYGWQPEHLLWSDASGTARVAALALTRAAPGGFKVLYLPRGPLLDWADAQARAAVLAGLEGLAKRRGVIFVKMDPEVPLGWGVPGSDEARSDPNGAEVVAEWRRRGWRESGEQIQFRNTALLDLSGGEADWLARMKSKSRYNMRLAERKGVTVRLCQVDDPGEDLALLYRMYAETSVRDGFVIRTEDYYTTLWRMFMQVGMAQPLIAEVDGEAVAGLVLFTFGKRAWYLYGMSRDAHREKMPNYLLQWEAMRRAKAAGCEVYDLWGAPDVFDESDSMWGVFRFKDGLGAQVLRTPGAWDFTARPLLYHGYTRVLPRILDRMRRRGKEETRRQIGL